MSPMAAIGMPSVFICARLRSPLSEVPADHGAYSARTLTFFLPGNIDLTSTRASSTAF